MLSQSVLGSSNSQFVPVVGSKLDVVIGNGFTGKWRCSGLPNAGNNVEIECICGLLVMNGLGMETSFLENLQTLPLGCAITGLSE